MDQLVIQSIGAVGIVLFILSYNIRSNRMLFLLQTLACGVFAVQFILLGALSGSATLIINMLRNAVLLKYNDWKWVRSKSTLAVFIAALGISAIFTWSGPASLLPVIGVSVSTIGYWTNNAQKIRLSQIACNSPCCLVYDAMIGSWAGVANEVITLTSIIVSIARYGWKTLGDPCSDWSN